jgi:hypothetical protein
VAITKSESEEDKRDNLDTQRAIGVSHGKYESAISWNVTRNKQDKSSVGKNWLD